MNSTSTTSRHSRLLSRTQRVVRSVRNCLIAVIGLVSWTSSNAEPAPSLTQMHARVQAATKPAAAWAGPRSGPPGVRGKTIALIAEDVRNGGVLGVAQGVREAAQVMGWKVRLFDAGGSPAGRYRALALALDSAADGVILVGMDAQVMHDRLQEFVRRDRPIVGWHVGPRAGPMSGPVAVNVASDPLEVARLTAMAAVTASSGRAGVVIFTDSNFEIALAKSDAMADVIRSCQGCSLLAVRDVAISRSADLMPAVMRDLLARFGGQWTHALAINDIYFDYAVPELTRAGLTNNRLSMLSAGDGSSSAFMRIQSRTFQTGTVAEPLNLHGWQLVDELNRLLAGQAVTSYVVPVHLVNADNVASDGGERLVFDPDNGYRDIYRSIWRR